jgi:uncharacterized protein (DUF362 family)
MDRRHFLKSSTILGATGLFSACLGSTPAAMPVEPPQLPPQPTGPAQVAFVKTTDRAAGVKQAFNMLDLPTFKGKDLFLKPNFNSADIPPGSTHNDTLSTLVAALQTRGVDRLTVGDRSGMGDTRSVMEQKEIFRMAGELGFKTLVFDDLTDSEWELQQLPDGHWKQGFAMPVPVLAADGIVQTCCLKTHRYGGHFTLSLKNSVGLAAKSVPGEAYNYMTELHRSADQRRMIAEINRAYTPDLVVLDGVEAFVDGGPAQGKLVQSNVVLAGTDRVAIDAVGVALLRYFGTTPVVSQGKIFEQEQLARAVALGLGVSSPQQIELVTDDPDSAAYARQIEAILRA